MTVRAILLVMLAPVVPASGLAAPVEGSDTPFPGICVDLEVPMRDGVSLATTVCLPRSEGPWAAVVNRTPYGRSRGYVAQYGAHGFALVSQDQRGLHDSAGDYTPHENELADGYDTVEWIASQPWSNGRVGITGYSALGIAAYMAAAAAPPHLVAAFVSVAPESLFYEGRFIGGMWKEADSGRWLHARGLPPERIEEYRRRAVLDDRWRESDFIFQRHRVEIPIYHVGGWYDLFVQGTLNNFRFLQEWGSPGARGRQKVLVGPFGHSGLSGDLRYPDGGGSWRRLEEELRWFDYWLRGIDNGIADEPPVRWYQMASARRGRLSGRNGWRTADRWPPDRTESVPLFLRAGGALSFDPPTERDTSATTYRADPANPVATVGGRNLTLPIGPMDQRVIGRRADYLRFETEPLRDAVVLAGKLDATLWVSTDATDSDFVIKLVDVYPDGYEALVLDTGIRARFRHGRRARDVRMMSPGVLEKIDLDMWHTAITFEPGHRIAVHIASSNSPRFDVNPQTGEPAGVSGDKPRVAENTIFHDSSHQSAVFLPIRRDILQ